MLIRYRLIKANHIPSGHCLPTQARQASALCYPKPSPALNWIAVESANARCGLISPVNPKI
jgi:hypothetical protein